MEKKIDVEETCCACKVKFENKIHELEERATAPTEAEHEEKLRELDSVFNDEKSGE